MKAKNLFFIIFFLTFLSMKSQTLSVPNTVLIPNPVGPTSFPGVYYAGSSNIYNNTSYGNGALMTNTTSGGANTAIGYSAMKVTTSGKYNTALGTEALFSNTGPISAVADSLTLGSYNVAIGFRSSWRNKTGQANVALGSSALYSNRISSDNTAVGTSSLYQSTGIGNTAVGRSTGEGLLNGNFNCFMGAGSAGNMTQGNRNTIVGSQSGYDLLTTNIIDFNNNNSFFGFESGKGITTGSYNTFIGRVIVPSVNATTISAGKNTNNTIILADGAAIQRFYIHSNGFAGIGLGNNVIPQNTLEVKSLPGSPTISGLRLTNLPNTSPSITNPTNKVLTVNNIGDVILVDDQIGTGGGTHGISNGCSNINFLPKTIDADGNLKCSQVFDNGIGVGVGFTNIPTASNFFNYNYHPSMFTNYTGGFAYQQGFIKLHVAGNARANGIWTTSDITYKTNINSIDDALGKVLKLKGKTYNWDINNNPDMNFDEADHSGFIAQEVEEIIPHLVITTSDGEKEKGGKKSVNYIELIPYLVESIKTLNEKITGLEAQIQCLNESTGCNGTTNKINTTSTLENTKIISVSPNPSNDVISVSLSIEKSVQTATLNVYDLNGKLMSSLNINDRSTNITKTLQKDNFGTGVYIVSLVVNGKSIDSKKIVFN